MLVLTRKLGEQLNIGSATVKFFSIAKHALVLDMQHKGEYSTVCVRNDRSTAIEIDGNCVYLDYIGLRGNQARIGIDAPMDINIVRSELLVSKPKNKKTSSGN